MVMSIKDISDTQMDSRHQENYLKKYDEKSLEKLQSKTLFTEPVYLFIFKKTEKIVAALYLITNLISDIEPIKRQIRKVSIGLMSDILNLKRLSSAPSKQAITGIIVAVSEIISLLKIASISGHVSPMNCSVVQKELTLLMGNLESVPPDVIGKSSLVLPQDFFNLPANFSSSNLFPSPLSRPFQSKGQYRASIGIKDNQGQQASKDNLKDIKDGRRDRIVQLLKAGKPLGIKDFVREIKDCGEKTIQRELLSMVESGALKKIGERRWSLYSLV